MANDELTFDVILAGEVKFAARRAGATEADFKVLAGGDMFAKILPVLRGYGRVVIDLLENVTEVVFPGRDRFVVAEEITQEKYYLGDNYKKWFLPKVEENIKPSTLQIDKLVQQAKDRVIVDTLGGDTLAETAIAEIEYLVSLQPNGERGKLSVYRANVFYALDATSTLRVVFVGWDVGRWSWDSSEVSRPYGWGAGGQVVSRKC